MADKELEDIVKRHMPTARIIRSEPIAGADAASSFKRTEAQAPETEQLLDKYFGKGKFRRDAPAEPMRDVHGSVGDAEPAPSAESVSIAEVELPSDGSDAGKRLAKRTILIDRKTKTILGSSG